jgi:regulator of replication initiation timing
MPAEVEPVDDGVAVTNDALREQLAQRSAEVAALRTENAALRAQLADGTLTPQVVEWKAKAAEYDALMQTKTMHAVRIPRAIYGRILARRTR